MSEIEALTEQPIKSKRGRKSKEELKRMAEEQATQQQAMAVERDFNMPEPARDDTVDWVERDMANQLLGRIQLSQGIQKVVTVTTLLDLKKIKDNNAFKHLTTVIDGKSVTVTTFKQFCQLLGRSYEQVNEDLNNLESFGGEALESMQQMGLGYRDLRKLRKLPDEDRQVLVQEIEADVGDKDSILQLIDDLGQKHMREIGDVKNELAAMQGKLADAEKEKKASDTLLADKEHRIKQLLSENQEIKGKKPTPDERIQYWAKQLTVTSYQVGYGGDNSLIALQVILQGIQDDYPDGGVPDTLMIEMANKMNDLRSLIDAMCQKYDLWQQMELIEAMSGEQFNPAPLDTETENEG